MSGFAKFTLPLTPEEFLIDSWRQRAVHLRDAHRQFDDLPDWNGLKTVLRTGRLTVPKFVMSRADSPIPNEDFTTDGSHVDADKVEALFHQGASFSIRGIESHWLAAQAVIDAVAEFFEESVHTNVYCTPATSQGFRCHYDLHEVFVLQIAGRKRWRVFWPTTEAPVDVWSPADAPDSSTEPYLDIVLAAGDVLYIPRGHWHYAVTEDDSSVHITCGVTCRSGAHFLQWLKAELMGSRLWRENAPLLQGDSATDQLTDWADCLRHALIDRLSQDSTLVQRFVQYTLNESRQRRQTSRQTPSQPSIPFDDLLFEKGSRSAVIGAVGHSSLTLKIDGTAVDFDDCNPTLIKNMLAAETPFSAVDAQSWAPAVPMSDVSTLLEFFLEHDILKRCERS